MLLIPAIASAVVLSGCCDTTSTAAAAVSATPYKQLTTAFLTQSGTRAGRVFAARATEQLGEPSADNVGIWLTAVESSCMAVGRGMTDNDWQGAIVTKACAQGALAYLDEKANLDA